MNMGKGLQIAAAFAVAPVLLAFNVVGFVCAAAHEGFVAGRVRFPFAVVELGYWLDKRRKNSNG